MKKLILLILLLPLFFSCTDDASSSSEPEKKPAQEKQAQEEPVAECGNARCEDGETTESCPSDCKPTPPEPGKCGDGYVNGDEECDGSRFRNPVNPNCRCTANCTIDYSDAGCGDGYVDYWEECDAGANNGKAGSGCSSSCTIIDNQ